MRTVVLIMLFLLILLVKQSSARASATDTVASVCVADVSQTAVPVGGLGPPQVLYDCRKNGYPKTDVEDPTMYRVKANDFLLLRFYKNSGTRAQTTLGDGGLLADSQSIVIYYGKQNHQHRITLTEGDLSFDNRVIFLNGLTDAEDGDVLTVQIRGRAPLYFRWKKPYGLYNNHAGFWIPIGLLSTNFSLGSNGITLAPMPIGIAWGIKLYLNEMYLGLSLAFNYTIHPINDSTGKATGAYSFTSFTPAALIDFNGYVYAGYGYGLRFDDISQSPGSLFVVGVGPALLSILKD